jgi:ATP-dependent DNA helicase RecQ
MLGADYSEQQLRAVMRQLIAIRALHVHPEEGFSTLHLNEGSRAVLKGDVPVQLRESTSSVPTSAHAAAAPHHPLPPI